MEKEMFQIAVSVLVLSSVIWYFCQAQGAFPQPRIKSALSGDSPRSLLFVHGKWFDGEKFTDDSFYCVNGVLTRKRPTHLDLTIDLGGHYIVPPYGDAHEHNFAKPAALTNQVNEYLQHGIFYAQGVTEPYRGYLQTSHLLNRPGSIDATFAHGGLTGEQGHPKEIYEAIALGLLSVPGDHTAAIRASTVEEGDAYWIINSAQDLEAKWPLIIATHPQLVKIYLVYSEFYAEQQKKANSVGDRGLNPDFVPIITSKAHHSGLKVVAHVDTAFDYRVALHGGVDEMAHLPGYCRRNSQAASLFRLTDDDVAQTAKRHVRVIATASICDMPEFGDENRVATRSLQIDNLKRLKATGVQVIVGSDSFGSDSVHEADYLQSLGVWTNAEMLKMWASATPHDIFPERMIGKLEEGYEASFLVLADDPLRNWNTTQMIVARWKQGMELQLPWPSQN